MIVAVEKAWMWLRIAHIDDILDRSRIANLAIDGHIQ